MDSVVDDVTPTSAVRLFGRRVGFNGVTQLAPMLVALVLTPVLLHRLGVDRFGIWSLALLAIGTLTSLDGGLSASLVRYFAMHTARDDARSAAQLLAGAIVAFAVFGAVMSGLAYVVVPVVVPHLHIPAGLESEATTVFRWLPAIATLGLVGDASIAMLQGGSRFGAAALATTVSVLVFLVAVLELVHDRGDLPALLVAAALRYVSLGLAGFALAHRHLRFGLPLFPSRTAARELGRYASRMQLASLVGFVNAELDGFVIAAVAPVRYVALYGVGLQLASAARSVPLYAFSPLLARLTTTFGRGGREAARAEFERLERVWLPGVLAFGVVAVTAAAFIAPIWLGHGYGLASAAAAILLAGYVAHVGFTGVRTCYVRAVGRPGLEARYSTYWTVLNAVSTVPMALLAGMVGVVAATAGTGVLASAYFARLCAREEGLSVPLPGRAWWVGVLPAAALTAAGEALVLRLGWHGIGALAAACIPPLVGLGAWLAWLLGRSGSTFAHIRLS